MYSCCLRLTSLTTRAGKYGYFMGMGTHFCWSLSRHSTLVLESTDILWAWVRIFAGLSRVIQHSCWKVWIFYGHGYAFLLVSLASFNTRAGKYGYFLSIYTIHNSCWRVQIFIFYLFLVDMGMHSCSSLSHYPELMLKSVDVLLT